MKNLFTYIILSLVLVFSSCDKLPEAGDLPGNWQLMAVESDNGVEVMTEKYIFWAERQGFMSFQSGGHDVTHLVAHVVVSGDRMRIYDMAWSPLWNTDKVNDTWIVDQSDEDGFSLGWEQEKLSWFGFEWPSLDVDESTRKISCTLTVISLESEKMVLRTKDGKVLRFRKF